MDLREQFRNGIEILEAKIINTIQPKMIQSTVLNGDMFLNLIYSYIEAFNSEKIPEILTTLETVT